MAANKIRDKEANDVTIYKSMATVQPRERDTLMSETTRYSKTIANISEAVRFTNGAPSTLEAIYSQREDAQLAIHIANRFMGHYVWHSPVRTAAKRALDASMIDLYKAKWLLGRRDGTYTDFVAPSLAPELGAISSGFIDATKRAVTVAYACMKGETVSTPKALMLESKDTEILFAGETPLVPSICPVVILSGTNYEMGRQYAKQVVQIYGSWIFDRVARREINEKDRSVLAQWIFQLQGAMPEVIEFAEGWSEGAQACGIPMTREHAIMIWTGIRPPSTRTMMFGEDLDVTSDQGVRSYLGGNAGRMAAIGETNDMCSGVCAWGAATVDGRLVAGSTTDHECTFQATIVAYPTKGNNFIYTPFSVNGSTPVLGRQFMAGHPGFNNRGVAYVHHGGASLDGSSSGGGPLEEWGYGVRRGAATFHALQFANTAMEAKEMMLNLPVGDPGAVLGTAGGMFADAQYGVVMEKRDGCPDRPRPILREATYDRDGTSYDFLYANNNALSPDIGATGAPHEVNYQYTVEGGWHILRPEDACTENPALIGARMSTKNSAGRNRYMHEMMLSKYGKIDLGYIKAIYRLSGSMPNGKYEDVADEWRRGQEWQVSSAHRGNAFTALMEPSAVNPGAYHACIGPAARFLQVREPSHGYYYYDETNTFWTLRLAETPTRLMDLAEEEAAVCIEQAQGLIKLLALDHPGRSLMDSLLQQSRSALVECRKHCVSTEMGSSLSDQALADIAFRTRAFTRAQVRATQVIETLLSSEQDTGHFSSVEVSS